MGTTRHRINRVTGTPALGVELSRHDGNHSPPYRTGVGISGDIPPFSHMLSWSVYIQVYVSRRFLKKVAVMRVSSEGQNLYSLCSRPFRGVATLSDVK